MATQRELTEQRLPTLETALEQRLGLGSDLNIADIAAATTVALHEVCGGDFSSYPAVGAWFQKLKTRPSFLATAPMPG